MAFCKQCGTNLDGAKFCPGCGTAADSETVVQQRSSAASVNADIRRQSLADMSDMINYFGAKKAQYDALDHVSDRVNALMAKRHTGWLTAGIVCALLAVLLLCVGSSENYFLAAIVMLAPPAGMIALYVLLRKKTQEKLSAALIQQADLTIELTEYYNAYGYCPFGFEYTSPLALNLINDVIREGRANTPEAAINVLNDDIHKLKMEQAAEQAADASIRTAQNTEQIAKNTKDAAKSARKAANYASASFWFKD